MLASRGGAQADLLHFVMIKPSADLTAMAEPAE